MKKELVIGMFLMFGALFNATAQQTTPTERKVYIMGTNIPQMDVQKIISALPDRATVKPNKPRRLLIFDLNVNYGGHPSAAYANVAFKLMGEKTGAFEAVVSSDVNVFKKENIFKYDAVFFNNNVGNLFEDVELRENVVEFVYSGGGLMGVHGTSVAFTKWPGAIEDWQEFGVMLSARGAYHRENTEPVVSKIEDRTHPLVQAFKSDSFEFRDEYFRFPEVYSRERVRVLLSIDTNKTDLSDVNKKYEGQKRKDNDYAVAWVKNYGKGRVFYSTIAHNPYVFYDPIMLKFYFDAAQFILGDLKAPTTPSARLDSRNLAFEKVNWQVGFMDNSGGSIEKVCRQAYNDKILFAGIRYGMQIFDDMDIKFSLSMTPKQREKYRLMLDKYCIRVNSCRLDRIPVNEQEIDQLFEFLDLMGIENVILPGFNFDLKTIEKYCQKYGLKTAVESFNEKNLSTTIKKYGEQIGAALPVNQESLKNKLLEKTVALLKNRVFVFEFTENGIESQDKLEKALKSAKLNKNGCYVFLLGVNGEVSNKSGEILKTIEKVAKESLKDN